MSRAKGTPPRDEGVAALEFALVLPVFMAIVLGAIDYGYYYFVYITSTNAAREGARAAVVETVETEVPTVAIDAAETYLENANLDSGLNVPTVAVDGPASGTGTIEVTVSVDSFAPLVGFVPVPSTVTAVSSMRWEMTNAGSP